MALAAAALAANFPSLSQPLSSSAPLLGLYFAASWCPDCTAVTAALKSVYEAQDGKIMELVYVSSDSSESQMKDYAPQSWSSIPFDQMEERSGLKRHFGACAGKETKELGVDRKFGIPTLIVLDSSTGRIITTDGANDIMGPNRETILNQWKATL